MKIGDFFIKCFYVLSIIFASKKKVDRLNKLSISEAIENKKEITILIHGIATNYYRYMYGLVKWFRKHNICIVSVGYDYTKSPRIGAYKIKGEIEEVIRKAGVKKVNILGISQGGLVARYYIELLGGKKFVDKFVTIYSPIKEVSENSIGFKLNKFTNGHPELSNTAIREIDSLFSIKKHLAIYGKKDEILGNQYPIPKRINKDIIQIPISGRHLFITYEPTAMKLALDYLEDGKLDNNHLK